MAHCAKHDVGVERLVRLHEELMKVRLDGELEHRLYRVDLPSAGNLGHGRVGRKRLVEDSHALVVGTLRFSTDRPPEVPCLGRLNELLPDASVVQSGTLFVERKRSEFPPYG